MRDLMSYCSEKELIIEEYRRRAREIPSDYYSLAKPVNLYFHFQKLRVLLPWLKREGFYPSANKTICEVGCGDGNWLIDFIRLGIEPHNIFAIDLDEERVKKAVSRIPTGNIIKGDASQLPWPDNSFDFVLQSTVFTSILDASMKRSTAFEMIRVVKPSGIIIWYDFMFNNPNNDRVRGVGKQEVRELFPNCIVSFKRVTLAPPLARFIVPFSWTSAALLEKIPVLRTHLLALIQPSSKNN